MLKKDSLRGLFLLSMIFMQIYLARNNQQAGPYTLDEINTMLADQQVLLTDLAWHKGLSDWKTLGELTQGHSQYYPNQIQETPIPEQPKIIQKKEVILAQLNDRGLAKLIDLILWLPMFAIPSFLLSNEQREQLFELQSKQQTIEFQQQFLHMISSQTWIVMGIYAILLLTIQAAFLTKSGQSIGKKAMKIRIVDQSTFDQVPFYRIFMLRTFAFVLFNLFFAPITTIIDTLFIFSTKKQTVHDRLAKTIVIKDSKNKQ